MFSLLGKYIIYSYNDSALGFLSSFYRFLDKYDKLLNTSVVGLSNNKVDFLSSVLKEYLSVYLNFVTLNNVFVLIALALGVFFSNKLFKNFIKNTFITVLFFSLYLLSIYFIFRVISATSALYFIFVFPMTYNLLIRKRHPLIIGLVVFLSAMISNYYGFFLFVVACFWYLSDLVLEKIEVYKFFKNLILFIMTFTVCISIFVGPLLYKNLPIFGNYEKSKGSEFLENSTHSVYRPINNWYAFSFRPWYFFIPPKSSLFFGDLSKSLYKKIESTNYYLADDYMEEEMAGSYMGWHFLLGMGFIASLLLIKKYKKKEYPVFKSVYENKEMICRSFFIIFCILLISGPPSFTVRGITIYTPSYLLYYIIPVFRTLVRWAVVIYLFVLIINSYLVQDLYNLMKKTWQKILFIVGFLTLNFIIFAIKIPVININKPPVEIAYLKKEFPESVPYAVYPKGDYYSIFWIISHEDLLINPVNFVNYKTGFNANEFSKKLITKEGINEFLNQNPKYLVYYPDNISDDDLAKISEINPEILTKEDIAEFFEKEIGEGIEVPKSVVYRIWK